MQCYNCQKFDHVWANWKHPPLVCGAGAVICTRSAQERAKQHRYRHAATENWWMERNLIPPTIEATGTPRKRCERESSRVLPRLH
jgi:hypothetical protein